MLIGVAGMVGCGKTTLATALAENLGYRCALEPVGQANPWLDRYYLEEDGKQKYGLQLQLHFLVTRIESLRRMTTEGGDWVIDTTWYADADVFTKNLLEEGILSQESYDLYRRIYNELLHTPAATPPAVLAFLDGPFELILERIRTRGRPSEQDVDPAYWETIHRRYRTWADNFDLCPVVRLDIRDHDLKADPSSIGPIADRLLSFARERVA